MYSLEYIKNGILRLYETQSEIHVSVVKSHPKQRVEKSPAVIVGVYKNIFQVEERHSDFPRRHTIQYGEILIGQIVIDELDYVPSTNSLKK